MALLMVSTVLIEVFNIRQFSAVYALSEEASSLIPRPQAELAKSLIRDPQTGSLDYNKDFRLGGEKIGDGMTPKYSASFALDPKSGVAVTDPSSGASMTMVPKFGVHEPSPDLNRVIYPLRGYDAQKVYTLGTIMMKEDIIINKYSGDKLKFSYELKLPTTMRAEIESNGSLGVYGVEEILLGDVQTGNDKDAKLLEEARKNAKKTNLLFTLPAPFIVDSDKKSSKARAWYGLNDDVLTIYTSNLKDATYPISIDPTVYIETAAKLMKGNNESNIDFDIDNELIQKGKTTGGRFDAWETTLSMTGQTMLALPQARWQHSTAAAGGYMYVVGGMDSAGNTVPDVYWAKLNTQSGVIEATNPGNGACASWCSSDTSSPSTDYRLPQARRGGSLVAYNGYLYYFGGFSTAGATTTSVYIAKLGANGSPELWHPTDTNKSNWSYWYQDSNMSTAKANMGAVAYNNRMYLLGGRNTGTTGLTTVESYDISPIGRLLNRTAVTALPQAVWGLSAQVYNDRLYVLGGAIGTTTQNNVRYAKISTDGSISSWYQVASFLTSPRVALGGNISTVWGGFIYLAAGCSALNANGHCTTIANDIQLGSINADGSISNWTTVLGITNSNLGYGFVAWRNKLYSIGGCTAQNATSGVCSATLATTKIGSINQDGDASTVSTSVYANTAPCSGTSPYNCTLPDAGDKSGQGGQMSGAAIINNGYIYYMGGCSYVQSGSVCYTGSGSGSGKASTVISYAAINPDGSIVRAPTCATGFTYQSNGSSRQGSWCLIATGLPASLAAFGYATFNNTLYLVGGTTGASWYASLYRTTFNNNGTWNAWTLQSFASIGIATGAIGYNYSFTRANPNQADTYPGNLYLIGGCSSLVSGVDCSANHSSSVYKCYIKTDGSIELSASGFGCTTSGQAQLDAEPMTSGVQGLGAMAGTVYANYVYLIGGQTPNEEMRGTVMYAKIDNNNNIVATDGTTTSPWTTSPHSINPIRRRGVAFGYNGYLYALAGYNMSEGGSLNDLLYAKIDVSDGSLGVFVTSTVTVTARWDLRSVVNNGFVYAIGGCNVGQPPASCSSMSGTVQTFQLYNNSSGSPAGYAASANLFATDRIGASSTIMDGFIYLAGGCTGATDCAGVTDSVQFAPLNPDGSVGVWQAATALPAARSWGRLVQSGGSLYYVGGQDVSGVAQATVYHTKPTGGVISTWQTATNGLPSARTRLGATVWNNRIYATGGLSGASSATNTVYVSPQLKTGGDIGQAWTATTDFPVARSGLVTVAYANNIYIFGGHTGSSHLNDAQYAQIKSDGTLEPWNYTTSLPYTFRNGDGFAANGFMYVLGGRTSDSDCVSHTFVAPISANTTIASGNKPTGVGEWYETAQKYAGERYGASVSYDQGKLYLLGGACGSGALTYTGANRVLTSTVQAQPQIARYSRMIDTDSDVTPTVWLMNGLDNSTGARWYMRYRSSTHENLAWGVDTNFGEITLSRAERFYPKDGAGVNTNRARFYYLIVTIDSQQAYGYPEDVSRGPTIADLSLFYTADPNKRLLHGKTFSGGEQQPLDTPCSYDPINQPNCPVVNP